MAKPGQNCVQWWWITTQLCRKLSGNLWILKNLCLDMESEKLIPWQENYLNMLINNNMSKAKLQYYFACEVHATWTDWSIKMEITCPSCKVSFVRHHVHLSRAECQFCGAYFDVSAFRNARVQRRGMSASLPALNNSLTGNQFSQLQQIHYHATSGSVSLKLIFLTLRVQVQIKIYL